MSDDPIEALECELVAAARRVADPTGSTAAASPVRRLKLLVPRTLLFAAVLVPVVVVLVVSIVGHSGIGGSHATGSDSVSQVPSAVLDVLRRSGVAPRGQGLRTLERVAHTVRDPAVTLQRASLRQITVSVAAGDTVPLDLAVVDATDGQKLVGLTVPPHSISGLAVRSGGGSSGAESQTIYLTDQTDQAYATVPHLRANGIGAWLGDDREGTEDYAVLVPDGVTRVRLDTPGDPAATVHDNVAGFRLSNVNPTSLSKQLGMTWLNASGRVVHRVTGVHLPGPAQLNARVDVAIRSLRAHLAVLRRRPTVADRAQRPVLRDAAPSGATLIASSVRVARTTATSGPIVIAVVRETADGTAGVLIQDTDGGSCCTAPRELLSSGGVFSQSALGGASLTLVLVPDGVRAVALHLGGQTVRASVVGNVAVLSGSGKRGRSSSMTWYGAGGRVIRRVTSQG